MAAAQGKCDSAHFVCNDPRFFPKLDQTEEGYAGKMHQVMSYIAEVSTFGHRP